MFLTTEPSLFGQEYSVLRVIHTTRVKYFNNYMSSQTENSFHSIIESALGDLQEWAANLGADGVIGVHHTTSIGGERGDMLIVTAMGTAIKF
jgi:uncharacterized protein YbjQ (UPF0145 family)